MIKNYTKDLPYTYVEGFFPSFELINSHVERLISIYVNSSCKDSDGLKKIQKLIPEDKIIFSDKPFSVIKAKENSHVISTFKKEITDLNEEEDHLVLVNPSDMGNLGNAMRTLLAFDLKNLAVIQPCADVYNPKVIRASMGAFFNINIELFPSFEKYLEKYRRPYYPFVLQTDNLLSKTTFKKKTALVFGNEATGLPSYLRNENSVRIEQSSLVDSLNLTTSIAIALYQLKLQRD